MFDEVRAALDPELGFRVDARVDAMVRHFEYLRAVDFSALVVAQRAGWSMERLAVLAFLNSFYQIVLSPQQAFAYGNAPAGLRREVPVVFGHLRFDAERARAVRAAHDAFMALLAEVAVPSRILWAAHADELLLVLNRQVGPNES